MVSHLDDRVVQRSILQVLSNHPPIRDLIRVPTSFGGIEGSGSGVRKALREAVKRVQSGARYYVRSDIRDFFGSIRKQEVLQLLSRRLEDDRMLSFVGEAIEVELHNLGSLGRDARLFPLHEIGVAQGCCLSPLLGNLLLHDFNHQLNGRGLHCLRYIDDFLLLGRTETKVRKGFESALGLLESHGLTAYDPWEKGAKAGKGWTERGFTFLGCEVRPDCIRPSSKARRRLVSKLEEVLVSSRRALLSGKRRDLQRRDVLTTLTTVDNVLRGWGNQYSFCNDSRLWRQLDQRIDELIRKYLGFYSAARNKASRRPDSLQVTRRLLGVHLLEDSKSDPILKPDPPSLTDSPVAPGKPCGRRGPA